MDRTEIKPRADVAYVRERVWLMCASCDESIVVDSPKVLERKSADR